MNAFLPLAALALSLQEPTGRICCLRDDEIHVVDADGSRAKQLTSSKGRKSFPRWSPDGKRIAFLQEDGVYRVDVESGSVQALVTTKDVPRFMPWQLSWSPDGTRVAFLAHPGETGTDIHVVDVATKVVKRLTGETGRSPRWSPDGKRIAFMGVGGGLYAVEFDGANLAALAEPSIAKARDHFPAWSRDGRRIAFQSYRDSPGGGLTGEIWIVASDGTNPKKLVDGWDAAWSPEGAHILFRRGEEICVVDPDGTNVRVVTSDAASGTWSPDGKWIATVSMKEGEIRLANVASGAVRKLDAAKAAGPIDWSFADTK